MDCVALPGVFERSRNYLTGRHTPPHCTYALRDLVPVSHAAESIIYSKKLNMRCGRIRRHGICLSLGNFESSSPNSAELDDGICLDNAAWSQKKPGKYYTNSGDNVVEVPHLLVKDDETTSRMSFIEESDGATASLIGGSGNNMLEQMRRIFMFAGPALGIWLSGPIMSLIDTSVIGTTSSLELAALGPGTVMCDGLSYVFMFLSVATSNLIATALAHKDEGEAAQHLARLLFVAFACGVVMLIVIELSSTALLRAFVGAKNSSLVPAATLYVKIRGLAWPAVLVGMVAQSASLGMQDSWSPLNVLAVASIVNGLGDILLCTFLGYGIGGAAWATTVSQYIAAILMLKSLKEKGYNPLAVSVPLVEDLVRMIEIGGPVLLTMLSKVAFYTGITYLATSLGAVTLAGHQVMIGSFSLFSVWGEPLAQTAQSFMPGLIYGKNRNLKQAQMLLKTLLIIGAVLGFSLGCIAISIPLFLPRFFTNDLAVTAQMRMIALPFFCSIMFTPPTLALEGTLLAGRDMKFLGLSMASCFSCGSLILLLFHKLKFGLRGSWWTLVFFQLTRFIVSFTRLRSSKSVLNEPPQNLS